MQASRDTSCSSRACILRVAAPDSFESHEPSGLAVWVDEERDAARQPVEQPPVVADEGEADVEPAELKRRRRDVVAEGQAVGAPVPGERPGIDDLLGDEEARPVADLEVERRRCDGIRQLDLEAERLTGEE